MEFNFLTLTKKECIEGGVQTALNDIEGGRASLLDAYTHTLAHIEHLQSYAKTIHEHALSEFETYGEKEIIENGRKISKFEAGSKYDFRGCNYPGYNALDDFIIKKNLEKKDMEATIKTIKSKVSILDNESGELFEVFPPVKTSTTKLKISY